MTTMAVAMINSGLRTEAQVKHAEWKARQERRLARALARAQQTGQSADWARYSELKKQAPRHLRMAY